MRFSVLVKEEYLERSSFYIIFQLYLAIHYFQIKPRTPQPGAFGHAALECECPFA